MLKKNLIHINLRKKQIKKKKRDHSYLKVKKKRLAINQEKSKKIYQKYLELHNREKSSGSLNLLILLT